MSINHNPAISNAAITAWDGAAGNPVEITKFVTFGWSFYINTDIATDAVFNIFYHDRDPNDPKVALAPQPVKEVPECVECHAGDREDAQIIIPAGTKACSFVGASIPCKPGAFVSIAADSGDTANVIASMLLIHAK